MRRARIRRYAVPVVVPVLIAGLWAWRGGSLTGPKGMLGVKWGDDAAQAAAKLGVQCRGWETWRDNTEGFEVCYSEPMDVLGQKARLSLLRKAHQLEGIRLSFPDAQWPMMRDALAQELDLERRWLDEPQPYVRWGNGSLVRIDLATDGSGFTVMVAGPRFGNYYSASLLREGLGRLGDAMRPH